MASHCHASEYYNDKLKVTIPIPDGTQVVEGNKLKPMSEEEQDAFKKVFDADSQDIEQQLNQTIFTIGYYTGPTENGADASIAASAYPNDPTKENYVKEFATTLITSEEKETESMSLSFSEKLTPIKISQHNFLVSKGILSILSGGEAIFQMPIYYYVAEINNQILLFVISGEQEKANTLEESFLKMKIN
ncbi:MAG: hypothetical protein ACTHOO_04580 [Alcanivorax sp.]